MHLLDTTADAAGALIAAVTANLPPGTGLGRVRAATAGTLLADYGTDDAAVYGLDGCGDTWRVVDLDGGALRERTVWRDGVEIDRELFTGDPPPESAAG